MKKLLIGLKKLHGHVKRIGQKVVGGAGRVVGLGQKAVGHVVNASSQVQGLVDKASPLVALVGNDRLSSGLERVRVVNQGVAGVAGDVGRGLDVGGLIVRQSQGVLNDPASVMAAARAIQSNAVLGRQDFASAYNKARQIV